jgi:PAS domain S-box-containing protein
MAMEPSSAAWPIGPGGKQQPSRVRLNGMSRVRHLVILWLAGTTAIALVTWGCFLIGTSTGAASLAYMLVIVFASMFDSAISSVVLSIIAVLCLDYFFTPPIFEFEVASGRDIFALIVFVITSLVITGLVRRVGRLAAARRERAELIDLTHDTILVRDMNDAIIDWNHGAQELYGWTRQEAVGKTAREFLKTDFGIPSDEVMATVLRTGRWEGEVTQSRRDGERVIVSSRWALRRDEHARPIGTLETSNDITEYRRAQELLHRTQAVYLAEAQKLSLTGSFGWDATNGTVFWSEESFRIFGFDGGMTPSIETILQRIHPDDIAAVRLAIDRASSHKTDFDVEHRVLMPGGSVKYLRVIARVILDEPGMLRFAGAIMDVTAAKNAEERWQRAQSELAVITRVSALGQMAASIAHEINQPLTAIVTSGMAALRWLNREVPQIEAASTAVRRMIDDGKRASEVVQSIRSLVRKTRQQLTEFDLNKLVHDIVPLVQRDLSDHCVLLRFDLAPELPQVVGDRVQLQQVIINFVANGIQAMATIVDRPRQLLIRTQRNEQGDIQLAVQDSGVGIPADNEGRLFEAFFTTKPDGMGMGLAICRSIIEAHGGRVWAEATASEPGATFWLSLPASSETAC